MASARDTRMVMIVDSEPAQQRFLAIMAEQAARMARLIDDLLSLSRIELSEHTPPGDSGEFRITAQLKAVNFAYVPPFLQSEGDPAWPALKGVNGQLVLDRAALRLSRLDAGLDSPRSDRMNRTPATR